MIFTNAPRLDWLNVFLALSCLSRSSLVASDVLPHTSGNDHPRDAHLQAKRASEYRNHKNMDREIYYKARQWSTALKWALWQWIFKKKFSILVYGIFALFIFKIDHMHAHCFNMASNIEHAFLSTNIKRTYKVDDEKVTLSLFFITLPRANNYSIVFPFHPSCYFGFIDQWFNPDFLLDFTRASTLDAVPVKYVCQPRQVTYLCYRKLWKKQSCLLQF